MPKYKILTIFLILIIVALFIVYVYLFVEFHFLENGLKSIIKNNGAELSALVAKEKSLIKKEVEEKHLPEMTQYDNLAKKLEEEKNKLRQLQAKFKGVNKAINK